jgi:hypothetical protein
MTDVTHSTYVVAGNGASLMQEAGGRILASDRMVRTNNFFFEPQSYLGLRVDLAVMGGDPRVAPFMFETLWRCRGTYDVRAWTSHNPAVIRAGKRRFHATYQPLRTGLPDLDARVSALIARYDRKPMTGTYAVLAALGQGAERIILTGMDFYQQDRRYSYATGTSQRALLGADLERRKVDARQHDPALDLAVLSAVQEETGGFLQRASSGSLLDAIMPLAPVRDGPRPAISPTDPPGDWANRVGLYHISTLRVLRRLRRAFP